jgi:hypothetical protein
MHVTYVTPVTQVHHICISFIIQKANCIRSRARPVSSTYMVRLTFTSEFWWRLVVNLKPLCGDHHWPCLHALPFRKVRAPSHRIIQLHHNVFVLLVSIHDSGSKNGRCWTFESVPFQWVQIDFFHAEDARTIKTCWLPHSSCTELPCLQQRINVTTEIIGPLNRN